MSKRMTPCYDGRRHRWQKRLRYGGQTDWWCERCGKWVGELRLAATKEATE